jgi:hypothetical protein
MLGLTPKEIRPHLLDFERKGYTNPTLMKAILDRLRVSWRQTYRGDSQRQALGRQWPKCGLVRIQWAGPWTKPGVPMRARYRHTHWVGSWRPGELTDVFDVNAVGISGRGWKWFELWTSNLVPWLLRECEPGATGEWWPTHFIEIER